MSGEGGMMMGLPGGPDGMTRFPGQNRGELVGGPFDKPIFGGGGPQMRMPVERGNPIDQPIYGFNPMPSPDVMPSPGFDFSDPPSVDPMSYGGGKSGSGIDPTPIQGGGGNGGGANGPGLDHLKDYGPVVEQMKQYVQSMSGLIDQINSKF
jgi:hypothetical protein